MVPLFDLSAQRFPRLTAAQLEVVTRFANARAQDYASGDALFHVGDHAVPAWFVLNGSVELFGSDGFDRRASLQILECGQFTGELQQLTGNATITQAIAGQGGCMAIPLAGTRMHALFAASVELGEIIMRAFILRRIDLLERGLGAIVLGATGSAGFSRLQSFLGRNAYPYLVLDGASERGCRIIKALDLSGEDLPLLICSPRRVLKRASDDKAGEWLGITTALPSDALCDVAIVGMGPTGFATAFFGASERLSVLALDGGPHHMDLLYDQADNEPPAPRTGRLAKSQARPRGLRIIWGFGPEFPIWRISVESSSRHTDL